MRDTSSGEKTRQRKRSFSLHRSRAPQFSTCAPRHTCARACARTSLSRVYIAAIYTHLCVASSRVQADSKITRLSQHVRDTRRSRTSRVRENACARRVVIAFQLVVAFRFLHLEGDSTKTKYRAYLFFSTLLSVTIFKICLSFEFASPLPFIRERNRSIAAEEIARYFHANTDPSSFISG